MRQTTLGFGLMLMVLGSLGCSSSSGDQGDRCQGAECSMARRGFAASGTGSTDADPVTTTTDPSAAPANFGNAQQPTAPAPVAPPPPVDDMMMPVAGADSECEEGVFCVPGGPDSGCGQITFDAEVEVTVTRHPGNVFIVFDRSNSMGQPWNGQERWLAAGDAITRALEPLQSDISQAAAIFFPSPDENSMTQTVSVCVDPTGITCIFVPFLGADLNVTPLSCLVDPTDMAQIDFMPGPDFLTTFKGQNDAVPYYPVDNGATPLMEGIQEADRVLSSANLEGVTAAVVITDGEPNCEWDAATANQIVTDWRESRGIFTHVIGLPGQGGAFGGGGRGGGGGGGGGAQVLTALAQAGGTDEFVTPADPAALEAQLQTIVSETVQMSMGFDSCDIDLSPKVQVPDELLMIVEEPDVADKQRVPRDFGWSLNDAADRVTLTGALCEEAMNGRFTSITFEYACPEVEPPPPIPPLQ